jgi:hypothetical protein
MTVEQTPFAIGFDSSKFFDIFTKEIFFRARG